MSNHSFEDWLGKSIKGYRLESILGVGGVGCVFRATHPLIKKQVAIKILQNTDPSAKILERFFTEAKAANEIRHENVIDVIDFDQTPDGVPFMMMEYLEGKSLASLIHEEAPIPEARICHIAKQICSALSAAHTRGIIHRDLKGDNILLTSRRDDSDFVKVLDFGIAKLLYNNGNPTQAGLMIGTPLCIAPEQAKGGKVDARTDIYSLGVLLFQMCTARAPFEHDIPMMIVSKHISEQAPSPRLYNPEVSGILESAILRCLKKSPADRFDSMDALSKMLDGIGRPGTIPPMRAMEDKLGLSIDITSPFIVLPSENEAWKDPKNNPLEETQPTPLRNDALPRNNPPQKSATPAPNSVRSRPIDPSMLPQKAPTPAPNSIRIKPLEMALTPTMPEPIPAATTPILPETKKNPSVVLDEFPSGEQTAVGAVGDRSKKMVIPDHIIKTTNLSALDQHKEASKKKVQTKGSPLLMVVVAMLLAGVLVAILLDVF